VKGVGHTINTERHVAQGFLVQDPTDEVGACPALAAQDMMCSLQIQLILSVP